MDSEGGRHQPSNSSRRGENTRNRGRHHYLQLAGDIAFSLAEIQVPQQVNGRIPEAEVVGSDEVVLEIVDESRQEATGDARNRRGSRNLQITTDRGLPSSEPHIPRTGNFGEDQENQEDLENGTESDQQPASHQRPKPRGNLQGRSHYIQIASNMAASLSELPVPPTNDGGNRERNNAARHENGIRNARERSCQNVSSHQGEKIRESIPQQESLSEYNGDAVCGTGCYVSQEEAYPDRNTSVEAYQAGSTAEDFDYCGSRSQAVPTDSPSIMETESFTSTSSSFQSSADTFEERTTSRSKEFQLQQASLVGDVMLSTVRLENASGVCGEEEVERSCAEPHTKKSKRNPKVSEEVSLPGECSEARPEAFLKTSSSEAERHGFVSLESEQRQPIMNPDSVKNLPRAGRDDSPTDSCLGAEFQSLNVAENSYSGALNVSLHSTRNEDASFQRESNENSFSTLNSPRNNQHCLAETASLDSTDGLANVSCSSSPRNLTRVDREMRPRSHASEPAGFRTLGTRPKTCQQQCKRSKPKPRMVKKKGSHSSISADIDDDCESINRQLGNPPVAMNGFQRQDVEFEGLDCRSANAMVLQGNSAYEPHVGITSRQERDPVRRGRAWQNAQRLADNMAPSLQALVIQMLEQDEERLGVHIVNGIRIGQEFPPGGHSQRGHRDVSHGRVENVGEGSCAEGAAHQPQGKDRAKKSAKKKSHYVELAGLIAPELAAVNRIFANQQQERQQHQQAEGREISGANAGAQQMAVDVELSSTRENFVEPLSDARDHSRDMVPRVGSFLPLSATNQREANVERSSPYQSENLSTVPPRGGRRHGRHVNRNYDGRLSGATGQEKGHKTGKQKKKRRDQNVGNPCLQLAESLASPLAAMNAQLEQRQKQQRETDRNRAAAMNVDVENLPPQGSPQSAAEAVTPESMQRDGGIVTGSGRDLPLSRNPAENEDNSFAESNG